MPNKAGNVLLDISAARREKWRACFICATVSPVEEHHVFPREWSDLEIKLPLCKTCHLQITSGFSSDSTAFFMQAMRDVIGPDAVPATRFWFLKVCEYMAMAEFYKKQVPAMEQAA